MFLFLFFMEFSKWTQICNYIWYSYMNFYIQLTWLYEYSIMNIYIKLSIHVILLRICICNLVLILLFCYIFLHTSYFLYFLCICSLKKLKWRMTVKEKKEALSRWRETPSWPIKEEHKKISWIHRVHITFILNLYILVYSIVNTYMLLFCYDFSIYSIVNLYFIWLFR